MIIAHHESTAFSKEIAAAYASRNKVEAMMMPKNTIFQAINAVEKKEADIAIVQIESSSEGIVNTTVDKLCGIGNSLNVVEEIILDIPKNITNAENEDAENENKPRFFALGRNVSCLDSNAKEKVAIAFGTKNKTGALVNVLEVFYEMNINIPQIYSRPPKELPVESLFFMEFELLPDNHRNIPVKAVLERLKERTDYLKYLGSYQSFTL